MEFFERKNSASESSKINLKFQPDFEGEQEKSSPDLKEENIEEMKQEGIWI